MKKRLFGIIITSIMLTASPAMAGYTVFTPGIDGTPYTAAQAETSFLSGYSSTQTETFENFTGSAYLDKPINSYGGLDIAFGTITGGLNTAGYIANASSIQGTTGETPLDDLYLSNGDPTSQTKAKGDLTLALDGSYRALGFYATDWQDIGGSVDLLVSGDGWSDVISISVRDYIGSLVNDTMVYFSFYFDEAFDSVTFKASGNDGYGIDNLSVGAPTPIPGAIWLLGSGLLGLVGIRRRFA